jgi:hypothetical protein
MSYQLPNGIIKQSISAQIKNTIMRQKNALQHSGEYKSLDPKRWANYSLRLIELLQQRNPTLDRS